MSENAQFLNSTPLAGQGESGPNEGVLEFVGVEKRQLRFPTGFRAEPLQAFTFLNDVENPPNEDNILAVKAYEVHPLFWSRRQEGLPLLNGG